MKTDTTFDKIQRVLYKDKKEAVQYLTPKEEAIRERMMLCVSKRMQDPFVEDQELVNFLMHGCGGMADPVSQSQAYRDIAMCNRLLGSIELAAKNWYRYLIVEGAKKAYTMAMDKGDAKGAAAALDKLGKYTRCDKEDSQFDFDKLIPPSFEPTDDYTLIEGLTKIDNLEERRKQLRALAKGQAYADAEEAEVIDEENEKNSQLKNGNTDKMVENGDFIARKDDFSAVLDDLGTQEGLL